MAENRKSGKPRARTLTGAQAIAACLEAEDVRFAFGYPGPQAADLFAALDASAVRMVLARHEQGAVHEADGYARATGQVGTVLVSSGSGATNTVTGIATAYMDSVPLVVIAGQVPTNVIGSDSFQESDIVGITMPVVKHSFLVQSADELPLIMKHAFHIARTGRPGPVLVDVPSDIAAQTISFKYPASVNLPSYKPTVKPNARQVRSAAERIRAARRPVLYVGGGAVTSGAAPEVRALAELAGIPVATTLMGIGAFPTDHPLALGLLGADGSSAANSAIAQADLVIAAGARFSDRTVGAADAFAPDADIIHIDIDPAEIGKVREACVPIVGDLKRTLAALVEELCEKTASPDSGAAAEPVSPAASPEPVGCLMDRLSAKLDPETTIVTAEVGCHLMQAAQHIVRTQPRTFLASGGLGTVGFGFPAAVGAALGCPDKQAVCIAESASIQMNIQEMATAAAEGLPVKVLVADDGAGPFAGPDFVMLARAYGWRAECVSRAADLDAALDRMLSASGPYLLDATAVSSAKEA